MDEITVRELRAGRWVHPCGVVLQDAEGIERCAGCWRPLGPQVNGADGLPRFWWPASPGHDVLGLVAGDSLAICSRCAVRPVPWT